VLTLAAVWLLLLLAVPDRWLSELVGESRPAARDALPGMAVFVAFGATVAAPLALLRLSGAAGRRAATRLRLAGAAFPVVVPTAVAVAGGSVALVAAAFGVVSVALAGAWTSTARRHR
jgi:hypothetical protein